MAAVLTLAGRVASDSLQVAAGAGDWVAVACTAADNVVADIAGMCGGVRVHVAGQELPVRDPSARRHVGLSVVASRLPAVTGMRVVDLLQMAASDPTTSPWQSLTASTAQRTGLEERCRAKAGRVGLSRWLDVGLDRLPPAVAALTEVARGLLESPVALVWRRPDWVDAEDVAVLTDILVEEQSHRGLCVVEVLQRRDATFDGRFDSGHDRSA